MTLDQKRTIVAALSFLFLISLLIVAWVEGGQRRVQPRPKPVVGETSAKCLRCHEQKTPVVAAQWSDSRHAQMGVGCYECHRAEEGDPDAFRHEGALIATVVSPKDCGGCHGDIAREFGASHHAQAAQFIGSLDNVLGEVIEGPLAAANGCRQCHGSVVSFVKESDGSARQDKNGKPILDPATWPNTGIGRVNLDGSRGACSACHSRHAFSRAMARQPEVCGKCHMGPDHPQIEIYEESKHGIAFRTRIEEMNLKSDSWVLGVDYSAAPTCATCHMSATRNQPVTHDVGARISWTLRPVISKKLENWEKRREAMKDTCQNCHGPDFVASFYTTYDATIEMWNSKFAQPAQKVMDTLRARGRLTPTPFDEELEWSFYRLWHHEGRRARMGVSMQGPDYTQWHGFFEVAERFYFDFLPKALEASRGDVEVARVIKTILDSPEHSWKKGMSAEDRARIDAFYKDRYGLTSH
ncbi:MAG TPA: multiheme c-type cytochrome [Candidatus Polarisedimenticolia bacterium]|nr:multiheme c-type cytochrome [Candidatus Polarisedimenticolia bacterium]